MTLEEHEFLKKIVKMFFAIYLVSIISLTLVCSVSVIIMSVQSKNSLEEGVEAFRIYMESDYDYGEINQQTDVRVGER